MRCGGGMVRRLSCAACGREFSVRNRVKYCSERCRLEAMSAKAIQAYRMSVKDQDSRTKQGRGSASAA